MSMTTPVHILTESPHESARPCFGTLNTADQLRAARRPSSVSGGAGAGAIDNFIRFLDGAASLRCHYVFDGHPNSANNHASGQIRARQGRRSCTGVDVDASHDSGGYGSILHPLLAAEDLVGEWLANTERSHSSKECHGRHRRAQDNAARACRYR